MHAREGDGECKNGREGGGGRGRERELMNRRVINTDREIAS